MKVQPNGCNGECCQSFPLSYTYEEFWQAAWESMAKGSHQLKGYTNEEVQTIANMLIPLENGNFSCFHQTADGDCKIYDSPSRPSFCKAHPQGTNCIYCGTTAGTVGKAL